MTSRLPRLALVSFGLAGLVRAEDPGLHLRLIGEQRLPHRLRVDGTVLGGLSGIDYDPAHREWVSESDDKSEFSPGRFYRLGLDYDQAGFRAVSVLGVVLLRQPDGSLYPGHGVPLKPTDMIPDLESIRIDPLDRSIWVSSEGDRPLSMNPFVRQHERDGAFRSQLPVPAMFAVHLHEERGARHNLSFEGLGFSPDGRTLWLSMEAPIYEDGPLARVGQGALTRLTHLTREGRVLGQYAYPLDPIPFGATPPGHFCDNGVSEILVVDAHRLLFLERSGTQDARQRFHFHIRLYEVRLDGATDISALASLRDAPFKPMEKRLVLDFDTLGLPWIDNLEGVTWGYPLANGHRSLVLVSDDNFDENQVTQLLAFEVSDPR